jgi:CRISPR-associated protein Cas8b1/Cst1 subtype I-B
MIPSKKILNLLETTIKDLLNNKLNSTADFSIMRIDMVDFNNTYIDVIKTFESKNKENSVYEIIGHIVKEVNLYSEEDKGEYELDGQSSIYEDTTGRCKIDIFRLAPVEPPLSNNIAFSLSADFRAMIHLNNAAEPLIAEQFEVKVSDTITT